MRVLLAEDDPVLASVVVEALTDEGHTVTHVPTADEARQLADTADWDAMIVDSFSAAFDHLDPREQASLTRLAGRAPVVLATGRSWATRANAADVGVAAILRKPYDLDELVETLRSIGVS